MRDDDTNPQDQEILALLKDYPMPTASEAYFDQTLVRATHQGTRRLRNRWLMTGFSSALAAGLVFWMVSGVLLTTPGIPVVEPSIPGIVMTVEESRTINLVFASAEVLDVATLTVLLPAGVELSGFPGQREIIWQTSLTAGRNLLPLELVATAAVSGEILATLEHDNRGRTFRLRVDIS